MTAPGHGAATSDSPLAATTPDPAPVPAAGVTATGIPVTEVTATGGLS